MASEAERLEKSKLDMHKNIESFARTLHDCVRRCETPVGLFLMAKMVAYLVVILDQMIDSVHVEISTEMSRHDAN